MYPLVLINLDRLRVVVVGGGAVAERKVGELIAGGARPLVVSPTLTPQLALWLSLGQLEHAARPFQPGDLDGAALAIAATDDPLVNVSVSRAAPPQCLVNVVDAPQLGHFHTVASVRRGDLLLTVSTGGHSPALAAQIRRELATQYGPEYATIVGVFRRWRRQANQRITPEQRSEFWLRLRRALLDAEPHANLDALVVDLLASIAPQPAMAAAGK